jgi:hypothetical protein
VTALSSAGSIRTCVKFGNKQNTKKKDYREEYLSVTVEFPHVICPTGSRVKYTTHAQKDDFRER